MNELFQWTKELKQGHSPENSCKILTRKRISFKKETEKFSKFSLWTILAICSMKILKRIKLLTLRAWRLCWPCRRHVISIIFRKHWHRLLRPNIRLLLNFRCLRSRKDIKNLHSFACREIIQKKVWDESKQLKISEVYDKMYDVPQFWH